MLKIEVIDNEEGGHDDIIFSIDGLINEQTFDSYWLIVGANCQTFQELKNCIANLLVGWENKILNNPDISRPIYLALDISDDYIGCIRILKSGNFLNLTYGFTRDRDLVGSLNNITDFSAEDKTLLVNQDEFLKNLKLQINSLKNFS